MESKTAQFNIVKSTEKPFYTERVDCKEFLSKRNRPLRRFDLSADFMVDYYRSEPGNPTIYTFDQKQKIF